MPRPRANFIVLCILFGMSGAAALGYQMIWSRQFATGLGHEMPAVLASVAALFGGMALGAWILDAPIRRSARPGLWYAVLELVIAAWSAGAVPLVQGLNTVAPDLLGLDPAPWRHWGVALLGPLLVLLPATVALGATFPAMESFAAPWARNRRAVGALYASNTLGAMMGTLAGVFALAPALGFRRTIWTMAALNAACGLAALWCARRFGASPTAPPDAGRRGRARAVTARPNPVTSAAGGPELGVPWPVLLFVTGLLGIAYEIAGLRVLSQVLENTIYSYAAVLAIYLLGTAAGGALQQRIGAGDEPASWLGRWTGGTALMCLAGVWILRWAGPIYTTCRGALGDSPVAVVGAEMIVAAAVFLGPTLGMGAMFSLLLQNAAHRRWGVGRALAVNTLGCALAPWLAGVVLVPTLGTKWTLASIALGYALLHALARRGRPFSRTLLLPALALAGLALLPRDLQRVDVPPGGRVSGHREGVMASVAVVTDATGHRSLRVNNRFQMGGTAAAAAEYRHAHIPLLLHPAPRRALFLGLGTGITLGAAGLHEGLQTDGVELVPEVVGMMPRFEPENFSPTRHPRLKVFVADARRFVRAGDTRYDVIVADLFHPARDGAGTLYTREHFQAIRARLADGGLFCQWLPLHQIDDEMGRVITRTFLEVFPRSTAWLLRFNIHAPVVGLVGTLQPLACSTNGIEQRAGAGALAEHLKRLPLADSMRFLGNLLADAPALHSFARGAPLNTDDHPRVTFGAPRLTYQKNPQPEARLRAWMHLGVADWSSALGLPTEAAPFARRLSAYARARDVYLRGLMQDEAGDAAGATDSYVESARLSEEFTPGYAQCLSLASVQVKSNPAAARRLLERLIVAQPDRPVAREMLERLGP